MNILVPTKEEERKEESRNEMRTLSDIYCKKYREQKE